MNAAKTIAKKSMKPLKIRGKLIPDNQPLTVKQLRKWLKQNCNGNELIIINTYVPCEDCYPKEHQEVFQHNGFETEVTLNNLEFVGDSRLCIKA